MTIVLEDGTGLSNSNSYQSVAEFKIHAKSVGRDLSDFAGSDIENALRRGTSYLDNKYKLRWRGRRVNGRDQALDWPRMRAYDNEGRSIDSDSLPRELVLACNEATYRELLDPFSLTPDFVPAQDKIIMERVGPIETQYSDKGDNNPIPKITMIDEILSPLIGAGSQRMLLRY